MEGMKNEEWLGSYYFYKFDNLKKKTVTEGTLAFFVKDPDKEKPTERYGAYWKTNDGNNYEYNSKIDFFRNKILLYSEGRYHEENVLSIYHIPPNKERKQFELIRGVSAGITPEGYARSSKALISKDRLNQEDVRREFKENYITLENSTFVVMEKKDEEKK